MGRYLGLAAVPLGSYDRVKRGDFTDYWDIDSWVLRRAYGPDSHLIAGHGIGPHILSAMDFYRLVTGSTLGFGQIWGLPPQNRYHQALFGGSLQVDLGEDWDPSRWSTAAEATEAAAVVREIAETDGPAATLDDLAPLRSVLEKYALFFDQLEKGEELVYRVY